MFAFYTHRGAELEKCKAIGWRTSFLKDYYAYMRELVKSSSSAVEKVTAPPDSSNIEYIPNTDTKVAEGYEGAWERSFGKQADIFMRGERPERQADRR